MSASKLTACSSKRKNCVGVQINPLFGGERFSDPEQCDCSGPADVTDIFRLRAAMRLSCGVANLLPYFGHAQRSSGYTRRRSECQNFRIYRQ